MPEIKPSQWIPRVSGESLAQIADLDGGPGAFERKSPLARYSADGRNESVKALESVVGGFRFEPPQDFRNLMLQAE